MPIQGVGIQKPGHHIPIARVQGQSPATHGQAQSAQTQIQHDKIHISLNNRPQGLIPASGIAFAQATGQISEEELKEKARADFGGKVVHVEDKTSGKKFLIFLTVTEEQEKKLKIAEIEHFRRFKHGNNNRHGNTLASKMHQAEINSNNPGRDLLNNLPASEYITENDRKEILDALKDYGIDAAAIGFTGRNEDDLKDHWEDKFFITIFDRDKEEFEDYFKGGFDDFIGDMFGRNDPDNVIPDTPQANSDKGSDGVDKPKSPYKWRFFRPSIGAKIRGLKFAEYELKPKVDLLRMRGPAATELRLTAEVPFNFKGEYEPEFELRFRRLLFHNPTDYGAWNENLFFETRTQYEMQENQLKATLGLRKPISPDSSFGIFGMFNKQFSEEKTEDYGAGMNYQVRWE